MDKETILSPQFQEEFTRIKANFEKQSIIVFKLLSTFKNYNLSTTSMADGSSSNSSSAPYLSRLLLRMDYNNYLTILAEKVEAEKN